MNQTAIYILLASAGIPAAFWMLIIKLWKKSPDAHLQHLFFGWQALDALVGLVPVVFMLAWHFLLTEYAAPPALYGAMLVGEKVLFPMITVSAALLSAATGNVPLMSLCLPSALMAWLWS